MGHTETRTPTPRKSWPHRLARATARTLAVLAVVLVLVANADMIIVRAVAPYPPMPAARPAILDATELTRGERKSLGPCWWQEHRGQHVLYVEGDPYTMGYCNSRLAKHVMERQEAALHAALETFLPWAPLRRVVLRGLLIAYRDLPGELTETQKLEIAGIAAGYHDPWRYLGPTYGRILYYHAIHDISQALIDNPLLACTSFGAAGSATADRHTLLARNFDFEGGRVFDEDKVVAFYRPQGGFPFVSVVWAGMAGAVTGMNTERIGVILNAAGTDDLGTRGMPTTLVVRSVLEHAATLDEAIAIIKRSRVFVGDIFILGDGKTGEMAVVELTPKKVEVRRSAHVVLATNHYREAGLAADAENAHRMEDGTTVSRFDRLSELVASHDGRFDVGAAVEILRDRKLPGERAVGLGHRGSIDALIAAHAVVLDLSARRLWVSRSPHTLGEMVEYDLAEVLAGKLVDHGALPADPLLATGGWDRFVDANRRVEAAERLPATAAITALRGALELVPNYPPALLALARACDEAHDPCSAAAWAHVVADPPPNAKTARHARERLDALSAPRGE